MNAPTLGEVPIHRESDIVLVRRAAREAAGSIGFGLTDQTRIVTASSELARNIFKYAGSGLMRWSRVERPGQLGIELQFVDQGPGIPDVSLALQEGYSTGDGLGMGLPGAKRLMDEMEIRSAAGQGVTVILKKWRKL